MSHFNQDVKPFTKALTILFQLQWGDSTTNPASTDAGRVVRLGSCDGHLVRLIVYPLDVTGEPRRH